MDLIEHSVMSGSVEWLRDILHHPHEYKWSVQGFGMLRTYLDADHVWRLNIWTDRLKVPRVSTIHDHPWSFTSWIMAGALLNTRYTHYSVPTPGATEYLESVITPGEGGGIQEPHVEPPRIWLFPYSRELYAPGCSYSQTADAIHETMYANGTITINKRRRGSLDAARVYHQGPWVSAEPHAASVEEITIGIIAASKELRRNGR